MSSTAKGRIGMGEGDLKRKEAPPEKSDKGSQIRGYPNYI